MQIAGESMGEVKQENVVRDNFLRGWKKEKHQKAVPKILREDERCRVW